jgi:hypothetical protein
LWGGGKKNVRNEGRYKVTGAAQRQLETIPKLLTKGQQVETAIGKCRSEQENGRAADRDA